MNILSILLSLILPSSLAFGQTQDISIYKTYNSYNETKSPAPQNAQIISDKEFERGIFTESIVWDIPNSNLPKRFQKQKAEVENILKSQRPDLWQDIESIPQVSSFLHSIKNNLEQTKEISLMGQESVIEELYHGLKLLDSKENDENLLNMLNKLRFLQQDTKPSDLNARTDSFCENENGFTKSNDIFNGDVTGNGCKKKPEGLFAQTHWPLKNYGTCIRDQGVRGTCVAFAITAAVELLAQRQYNKNVNLSEQHFYNKQKMHWYSFPPNYGDGLVGLLTASVSRLTNYHFYYENDWQYNPSPYRQDVKKLPFFTYTESCHGYQGRFCSDTNHQGQQVCTNAGGLRYCGYRVDMSGVKASPYHIRKTAMVYNPLKPDASLEKAKTVLKAGAPIVLSVMLDENFESTTATGLTENKTGSKALGGHAILLTGWIDNNNLPSQVPKAEGGGYFVIKNSWSTCAGDGGYYYLPYSWVRKRAMLMVAYFEIDGE